MKVSISKREIRTITIIIVAYIFLWNIVLFWWWWHEWVLEQIPRIREMLLAADKMLIYTLPMMIYFVYKKMHPVMYFQQHFWRVENHKFSLLIITALIWFWAWSLWWYFDHGPFSYSFFYLIIINSLVEETTFRWFIHHEMRHRYPGFKANIIQAVWFTLVRMPYYSQSRFSAGHWVTPLVMVTTICFLLGISLFFWFITRETKSLRPAIILHSINNAVIFFI